MPLGRARNKARLPISNVHVRVVKRQIAGTHAGLQGDLLCASVTRRHNHRQQRRGRKKSNHEPAPIEISHRFTAVQLLVKKQLRGLTSTRSVAENPLVVNRRSGAACRPLIWRLEVHSCRGDQVRP